MTITHSRPLNRGQFKLERLVGVAKNLFFSSSTKDADLIPTQGTLTLYAVSTTIREFHHNILNYCPLRMIFLMIFTTCHWQFVRYSGVRHIQTISHIPRKNKKPTNSLPVRL